jgi:hypothetical protein
MADAMHNVAAGPDSPAWTAVVITADAGDLARIPTRAIYVGGTGGDVTVTMAGGGSVQFTGVAAGTILPIRIDRMTATTASNVIALY